MITPTELLTLATRIEAAKEGSRELDFEIYEAVTGVVPLSIEGGVPEYTTSLDAAISAIREGCGWSVGVDNDRPVALVSRDEGSDHHIWISRAATPQLAVVAASLKERAG